MTEDEMVGWPHRLNGHELDNALRGIKDREAWCTAEHGLTESDMTQQLNSSSKSWKLTKCPPYWIAHIILPCFYCIKS